MDLGTVKSKLEGKKYKNSSEWRIDIMRIWDNSLKYNSKQPNLKALTEKIKKISDEISDMAFEYLMKFGVDISPVITNIDHFNYWADNLPYYRNVRDEGVKLSA